MAITIMMIRIIFGPLEEKIVLGINKRFYN